MIINLQYKKFAIDLAYKAGEIIKKNFTLGMKKQWKADNSPLTETDLVINGLVINSVKNKFPDHSILAEEGDNFSEKSEFVWVCDPVDGTIPFSHGIPTCVFSLALVQKGESILGVVYDPFMDRLFFAEKGRGAFMNNKKISVSSNKTIKNSLFGISCWKETQFDFSLLIETLKKAGPIIIDVLSITYMGALVSNGEFTGTIFPGNKPHDTAALKVIVEEAGGRVTDIFGNEQRYDREIKGHLITNGFLHKELIKVIKKTVK